MTRASQASRPISEAEAAVIEQLLRAAGQIQDHRLAGLRSLVVVDGCGCGCASVDFGVPRSNTQPAAPLLLGSGRSASGDLLGIMIWANGECISGLEVFSYTDVPAPLPVLASIAAELDGSAP